MSAEALSVLPDSEEPSRSTPLRHLLRNQARNWGEKVNAMTKHLPGVWWFDSRNATQVRAGVPIEEAEGQDGFIVCDSDFPISGLPGYEMFEVNQLKTGEKIYAFDGEADALLLQYYSVPLSKSVYTRGYTKNGHEEVVLQTFPTFALYREYLRQGTRLFFPEAFEILEQRERTL